MTTTRMNFSISPEFKTLYGSEWNEKSLTQLFEDEVRRRPQAIALTLAGERLTYRELNDCATLLASRLLESGVAPGEMVGLCMDRSTNLVASILGILKAGAAYVPIDPNYPEDRVQFICGDANLRRVIAD